MAESPTTFQVALEGQRLDTFLAGALSQSRTYLKSEIEKGNVAVNGRALAKPSHRLQVGDRIETRLFPKVASHVEPIQGPLDILFEDESILVLNKQQGIAVHPAPSITSSTLVHYLLAHLKNEASFESMGLERPGIVHRLDLGTSGVLCIAKTPTALEKLSSQFKERTVRKEYEAIVWGEIPSSGAIDSPIGRHIKDRKRMSRFSHRTRNALTHWKRLGYFCPLSWVSLAPHTGRTHQLRVHLSEQGFPIVGDVLYRRRHSQGLVNQCDSLTAQWLKPLIHPCLHARQLELNHPLSGSRLQFTAKRPDYFSHFLTMKGLENSV